MRESTVPRTGKIDVVHGSGLWHKIQERDHRVIEEFRKTGNVSSEGLELDGSTMEDRRAMLEFVCRCAVLLEEYHRTGRFSDDTIKRDKNFHAGNFSYLQFVEANGGIGNAPESDGGAVDEQGAPSVE